MRSFRLLPRPLAILVLLALFAVPPVAGTLLLRQALASSLIQRLGGDGLMPETPAWWLRIAARGWLMGSRSEPLRRLGWEGAGEVSFGKERLARQAAAFPESPAIQARWTLEQFARDQLALADKLAWLDGMIAREPENSLWRLYRGHCLMKEAASLEIAELPPEAPKGTLPALKLTVTQPELFAQGLEEWRRGLDMPGYWTGYRELMAFQLEALGPVEGLLDEVLAVSILSSSLMPEVGLMKHDAQYVQAYGEELLRQGKVEEARPLLRVWLPLAEKQLCSRDVSILGVSTAAALLQMGRREELAWRAAGRDREAADTAALWTKKVRPWNDYKEARKLRGHDIEAFSRRTGQMSILLLPAVMAAVPPDAEAQAWRQLEYLQMERLVCLAGAAALWLVLLAGLLFHGLRRPADGSGVAWSPGDWIWILVSVLAPLGLYVLVERVVYVHENGSALSKAAVFHWLVGLAALLQAALLAWLLPLARRSCRGVVGLALLVPALLSLSLCLLAAGSLFFEEPRLVRQAVFMQPCADGFTRAEAESVAKLKSELRQAVEAAQKPVPPSGGPGKTRRAI